MDLRAMLNTDGGGASRQQPSQPPPPAAVAATPHTPVQAGRPPPGFRDYSHALHASPGLAHAPPPHEYPPPGGHPGHGPPHGGQGPYASPTGHYPPAGAFASRPAPPPPLQPPGMSSDPRSPGSASTGGPSPYRHTPTSSLSAPGGGYPFPAQNQPPPSPQQRHQYGPPSGYPRDPRDPRDARDNYPSAGPGAPPGGMATPHHGSASYMQGQQAHPQTPPVGTPGGGNHPYLQHQQHQRSQSLQSTSTGTPTSAHAQVHAQYPLQHGTPYAPQGSPVATSHHHPPPFDQHHQRQSSQPPTPLGPPLSTPRQSSIALPSNFNQPPSPYQQRVSSSASSHPLQFQQTSPPPPHPPSIPRAPSRSHSAYDAVSDHRRSQSQQSQARSSERERSISVSPKTRVPSLPSSAGGAAPGQRPLSIGGESADFNHTPHPPQNAPAPNSLSSLMASQLDIVPAKRKLDDRDLRPEEMESADRRPPAPELNGHHGNNVGKLSRATTSSPLLPRRRKVQYASPPSWAHSGKGRQPSSSRNYVIKSKVHVPGAAAGQALVNGNGHAQEGSVKSEHASRHTSPEATRSTHGSTVKAEELPPNPHASSNAPPPSAPNQQMLFEGNHFPWEPSIAFTKPIDYVAKSLGDFLFYNVVSNQNLAEIQNRGVIFEIEAKLGTLIDRDTNYRLDYPVEGECVVQDRARVAFKSSMTEAQHKAINDWLNGQVIAAEPRNKPAPHLPNPHVPIVYTRRKEIDRFYELPSSLHPRLPLALQQLLNPKNPLKARVSKDEQGNVLAKIVKARVADWHLWMPRQALDARVSVNLEWEWDGPVEEIETNQMPNRDKLPDRNKNRLSYKHGFYQADLTQVIQSGRNGAGVEKEHELEVELDGATVVEHGKRAMAGAPTRYGDLVDGLIDSVRVLSRKCPP